MNISRRSFLKMAGLTTVAAAGAAMFTGCGLDMVTVKMVITDPDGSLGWANNQKVYSTKLFAFMIKDSIKVSDAQNAIDAMVTASGINGKVTVVVDEGVTTIPVVKNEDGSVTINIIIKVESDNADKE